MNDIINNLNNGKVIAIPTDTVYGLVCSAVDKSAINRIYEIKKRDKNKAISIFVKDINDVYKYVNSVNKQTKYLMRKYWPGALTIIFNKKDNVLTDINPGNSTIGIRIPNNELLLSILKKIDFPLAQTSCNFSGESPFLNSFDIEKNFSDSIDYIVKGKIDSNAIASTVIDATSSKITVIRSGEISEKERL